MKENHTKKTKSFGDYIRDVSENLLFGLFTLMVIIVFINVVARYVFNSSIVESEEIARYCFIWASLIGAVLALEKGEHISVDFVVKMLPPAIQKWTLVAGNVLIMILAGISIRYGWILAASTFGWPSPATRIPYGYIGLIIPITFLAMFVILIRNTVNILSGKP